MSPPLRPIAALTVVAILRCAGTVPATNAAEGAPGEPPQGSSVEDRAVQCRAFGSGPRAVLILGGIHGDEPASRGLAAALCEHLDARPALCRERRVVVVPAANPDGLARSRRTNARGVDINRNFAAANWQKGRAGGAEELSEPETRFLAGLLQRYEPAVVVQIHQGLACVDWDGPADGLAAAMAKACGLPAKKLGAQPGSLGSYAGVDRRIPTITLEVPRAASDLPPEALWQRYGEGLLLAIRSAHPPDAPGAKAAPVQGNPTRGR